VNSVIHRPLSFGLATAAVGLLLVSAAGAASGTRERESGPSVQAESSSTAHAAPSSPPSSGPSHSSPPPRSGGPSSGDHGERWQGGGSHGDRHHSGWGHGSGYRGWHDPRWDFGWNLGWWWGWSGYPVYVGPYNPYGYTAVYPNDHARYGALDLDVSPERAQIYLDGEYVGVADDYDGFPEYLWLEKGTYDLVIYLPGYKTLARQVTIYPGLVIDVEDSMESGESIRPENLGTPTHERRDARIRQDEEREQAVERNARRAPEASPEAGDREEIDARGEPARLRLDIVPEDASVYLDGRFLGTGDELAHLRSRLLVDPGEHRIEVVRPGYRNEEKSFTAEAGEEQEIEIRLEKD
jgi:hypothetical protein